MNKEEIEELKDFTIDLTDIDELALGLEVCSKKSNMVIQEFIDIIEQLQQENKELKKENKILRENAENNDKVVDKVNWENLKLKEHIEKYEHYCKTTGIEELMKENKKYKEVIDKAIKYIEYNNETLYTYEPDYDYKENIVDNYDISSYREDLLKILKEVE